MLIAFLTKNGGVVAYDTQHFPMLVVCGVDEREEFFKAQQDIHKGKMNTFAHMFYNRTDVRLKEAGPREAHFKKLRERLMKEYPAVFNDLIRQQVVKLEDAANDTIVIPGV